MGLTDAVLPFLEKRLLSISLLIILVKCKSMMFDESLIILDVILSESVAFFGFMYLVILFIPSAVACGKTKMLRFRFVWFLILLILARFLYSSIMFLTVLESPIGLLGFPVVLGGIADEF